MSSITLTYKTDIPNANGHIYPKEVFKAALEEYWNANKPILGGVGQEPSAEFPLKDTSHVIRKENVKEVDDGFVITATILPTPRGFVLLSLLAEDKQIYKFAIRGIGNISEDHKIKDLKIVSIDIIPDETVVFDEKENELY